MYVTVKCNQNLNINDVVEYNSSSDQWEIANSTAHEISVVKSTPENIGTEDTPIYTCKIIVAGIARCVASRDIPVEGGRLNVENGKVYVDNSLVDSPGFIVPKDINEENRFMNSIVRVVLK